MVLQKRGIHIVAWYDYLGDPLDVFQVIIAYLAIDCLLLNQKARELQLEYCGTESKVTIQPRFSLAGRSEGWPQKLGLHARSSLVI